MFVMLHLTVSRDGVVSLWDTVTQAQRVSGETYAPLVLTPQQAMQLSQAQKAATADNRGGPRADDTM